MEMEDFVNDNGELCSTGLYEEEYWCMGPTHILLRLLSLFASLAATIIMVLSKETAIVPGALFPGLLPVPDTSPEQYNYSSAFMLDQFFIGKPSRRQYCDQEHTRIESELLYKMTPRIGPDHTFLGAYSVSDATFPGDTLPWPTWSLARTPP